MQRREFMGTCAAVGAVGSAETVSVRPGADDTSAIQSAIDAVGQAGGGTVQFATGVYPLQKMLRALGNELPLHEQVEIAKKLVESLKDKRGKSCQKKPDFLK